MTRDQLLSLILQRGVHEVFGEPGEGWGIEQNPYELAACFADLDIQTVLEIGTGYRAGLARLMALDLGWHVTSLDVHNYHHTIEGVHFLTGFWEQTERPTFTNRFDLVFIDGDHQYEAVKRDHLHYRQYATKYLCFHDIAGLRGCEGVTAYWHEIAYHGKRLKPGYQEFIEVGERTGGIGRIDLTRSSEMTQTG